MAYGDNGQPGSRGSSRRVYKVISRICRAAVTSKQLEKEIAWELDSAEDWNRLIEQGAVTVECGVGSIKAKLAILRALNLLTTNCRRFMQA